MANIGGSISNIKNLYKEQDKDSIKKNSPDHYI